MKNAIVAESSDVVRAGLVAIVKSLGIFGSIHEAVSFAQLQNHLEIQDAPVLIANPSFFAHNQLHCLAKGYPTMAMAAVSYFPHDDTPIPPFHTIVCLSDSRELLHSKLTKLLKPIQTSQRQPDSVLSAREVDVLKLLVLGCSSKEISDRLFISLHTVLTHRKNITRKLNIRSVAGLTVYAILNGIISMENLSNKQKKSKTLDNDV